MAVHIKMALMFAALAAVAIAGRNTRDAMTKDDMEREEISRRQWQYAGRHMLSQPVKGRSGRPKDSRSGRNVLGDPPRKRSHPTEPQRSRGEDGEMQRIDVDIDPRSSRDELDQQRRRAKWEYLQNIRIDSEEHRRRGPPDNHPSSHESEDLDRNIDAKPQDQTKILEHPQVKEELKEHPHRDLEEHPKREESEELQSNGDESDEPLTAESKEHRVPIKEPKEPALPLHEIEVVPTRTKASKTTQGPFGTDTTTTTELSSTTKLSTTAATHATVRLPLPPLNKRYRRIYNADETALIEEHPYLAAVLMNNELWCGGAIISPDLVLTAAHCLQLQYNNRFFREYVKMLTVRIGSSNATAGGEHLRVDEIFFHPNYKPQTLEFNYAVVRLQKNISFDQPNVRVIEYSKRRNIPIDKNVTFLGWGSVLGTGDKGGAVLLQKVVLPVYDKADCIDIYGREMVTASNFCAGYISKMKNVCNHDAGGPAIMDDQVVGILSFSSKRCDEPDRPAVFCSAGAAAEWLQTIPEIRKKSDELQKGWMNLENDMQ